MENNNVINTKSEFNSNKTDEEMSKYFEEINTSVSKYYVDQLVSARIYEDFVAQLFKKLFNITINNYILERDQIEKGENANGIEIKFDQVYARTGNIYIETEERRDIQKQYVHSGIFRKDNSKFFLIGDYNTIYIFRKKDLQNYFIENNVITIENRRKTSKGFMLNKSEAEKTAYKVINVNY